MKRLGVDAGNNDVKVVDETGAYKFSALIGEARDRSVITQWSSQDMEWKYDGHSLKHGYAATLAKYESQLCSSMYGNSKFHEDARLRILLAIHTYGGNERLFKIAVGQPIKTHQRDKEAIKDYLKGRHTITVNGVEKIMVIEDVAVGIEGGIAYHAGNPQEGVVRIIDIGGGTVNLATIRDGLYQDRESDTLDFGMETMDAGHAAICRRIFSHATGQLKWSRDDLYVRLVGGAAEVIAPTMKASFPHAEPFYPIIKTRGDKKLEGPTFATAAGLHKLAMEVFR